MIHTRKSNPRAEYRLLQTQRIDASDSLAQKFPKLKSLTVDLEYFDANGLTRTGNMSFKPNLEKAKSLVCFNCPSGECVQGDYDLSEELSRAVSARHTVVTGEMRCQGVRHKKEKKEQVPCRNLLRYKLRLAFV
jgi:hypothetical protein